MSDSLKRIEIPIALTIIATLLQVIPYYLDLPPVKVAADQVATLTLTIVAMATFVGVISIGQVHGKRIQRKTDGWPFSIIVLLFSATMILTGLPFDALGLGVDNTIFQYLFTNMLTPLGGTMYSIIAFFITSAAFRAFRLKNVESGIVLIAGSLMVMSNAPIFVNAFPPFATIGLWIRNVPNMATMRAIMIGAALGAISLAIRTLMGIERGYLRGGGEE